ncbi:hypothetical protein F2C03_07030 [Salmonella enterica]|nr:hypothetical protein [Salmonella enterica]
MSDYIGGINQYPIANQYSLAFDELLENCADVFVNEYVFVVYSYLTPIAVAIAKMQIDGNEMGKVTFIISLTSDPIPH